MQFTEENIGEILRLLAGILHAGNIEFMTAGGAQVSSKSGQRVSPRLHPSARHVFCCHFKQFDLCVTGSFGPRGHVNTTLNKCKHV